MDNPGNNENRRIAKQRGTESPTGEKTMVQKSSSEDTMMAISSTDSSSNQNEYSPESAPQEPVAGHEDFNERRSLSVMTEQEKIWIK